MSRVVRIGLPKGSLQEATIELLAKAGYTISGGERSYAPTIDDPTIEVMLLRAQEIPRAVARGVLDAGICGYDWIVETQAEVDEIAELVYSKRRRSGVRWVLAVPEDSPIERVEDLEGTTIATELMATTRAFLAERSIDAKVEFSWGATEAKAPLFADAIVDVTETGASLRANRLRVIATVLESTTRLVANTRIEPEVRARIEALGTLLTSVIRAERSVALMMNVEKDRLEAVLDELPALQTPTVMPLSDSEWCDVFSVVPKERVRELVTALARAGAEGIIELPITKIVN